MVGHAPLEGVIGVRVPVPQMIKINTALARAVFIFTFRGKVGLERVRRNR